MKIEARTIKIINLNIFNAFPDKYNSVDCTKVKFCMKKSK